MKKKFFSDKVRDHCHLTGKYRGPAHSNCNFNITQDKSIIIPFVFHKFSTYDCHTFVKNLVDEKIDELKFKIIPKTNEEYISVTYGWISCKDSYRFLSNSLDSLVKTVVDKNHQTLQNLKKKIVDNEEIRKIVNELGGQEKIIEDLKKEYPNDIEKIEEALLNFIGENDPKLLKSELPDKWKYLTKKLAYPYEFFDSIEDYQKPVDILKKKISSVNLKMIMLMMKK